MATTRRTGQRATSRRPTVRALPLVWVGVDDHEITFVNQIMAQRHENQFFLSFGQATPPPIIGTPDEQMAALEAISFVPVKVVKRIALSPEHMRAMVTLLTDSVRMYDEEQQRSSQ